ncbi:hypothetical protein [Micromonospora sediminicola]|uniref:hypothetical protein n=1 Tax=Micromonospora sediminicola TaxID=946078 RepID=UPI0037BC013F
MSHLRLRTGGVDGLESGLVAELVELVEQSSGVAGFAVRVESFGEVVAAEIVVGQVANELGPIALGRSVHTDHELWWSEREPDRTLAQIHRCGDRRCLEEAGVRRVVG